MVGDHEIDDAVSQTLPELFSIRVVADWRCALALGRTVRDRFRCQMQVVGASLDRDQAILHREPLVIAPSHERSRDGRCADEIRIRGIV